MKYRRGNLKKWGFWRRPWRRGSKSSTIRKFLEREGRVSYGLISDGDSLLSYETTIGEWRGEVIRMRRLGKWHSKATFKHSKMLRRMATRKGIEIIEE